YRRGRRIEYELLESPLRALTRQDFVRHAAVDPVHRRELPLLLAGHAELADHRAVEPHLEDLARDLVDLRDLAVGVRVGRVEILVRPDAERPGRADVVEHRL